MDIHICSCRNWVWSHDITYLFITYISTCSYRSQGNISICHYTNQFLIITYRHRTNIISVSYTHLTLPTILLVQISVVAVSLKKKKKKKKKKKENIDSEINQEKKNRKTH
eukprot:TRINITY_DN505_c0_g1_i2.p3 TRINITY_DN505_c0_g1~~TRINITY_DN505_c0_g1_i2.p3  ORF type:complete len:110 (-),score=13.08 TRINITY_DN505_c0_g1_i2:37-366(-)